ncbi:MAG: serine hydrolase, partial [Lachnospiraceae bacterium]|nr:serine hydrolase [Lachnospiraceae bacterium]
MSQYNYLEEEIIKRKSASRRDKSTKQRKKKFYLSLMVRVILPIMIIIAAMAAGIGYIIKAKKSDEKITPNPNISIEKTPVVDEVVEEPVRIPVVYTASESSDTTDVPSDVVSTYGILIDLENDQILKARNSRVRICPASMTKILTVLVAAENIKEEDLDDTMTITLQFTDYSYGNDLSAVGFAENEVVTVRDLFYGTILPSGGDAAIALATYVAGSEEAFVELMNEKLKELKLSDSTHFTNVAGMYDEDHYSTVYDMAMILHAAIDQGIAQAAFYDMLDFLRQRARPWPDSGVTRACEDPLTLDRTGRLA